MQINDVVFVFLFIVDFVVCVLYRFVLLKNENFIFGCICLEKS